MTKRYMPAKIKRQILVEAGHRCAIPTCRCPTKIEPHHIKGWAKTKNHDPDHVIALCPNCHRRAEAGEIDKKSLYIYKKRCQQLTNSPHKGLDDNILAFIKFSPNGILEIIDSYNISSISDNGTLDFSIMFDKPLEGNDYITLAMGNGLVNFKVISQSKELIHVQFTEPCPSIVRLEFRN